MSKCLLTSFNINRRWSCSYKAKGIFFQIFACSALFYFFSIFIHLLTTISLHKCHIKIKFITSNLKVKFHIKGQLPNLLHVKRVTKSVAKCVSDRQKRVGVNLKINMWKNKGVVVNKKGACRWLPNYVFKLAQWSNLTMVTSL